MVCPKAMNRSLKLRTGDARASLRAAMLFVCAAFGVLLLSGCETQSETEDAEATQSSEGDAIVREAKKGPVSMRVEVTPKAPRLSDAVELKLEIRAQSDVSVRPPPFGEAVGRFSILDYREKNPRVEDGETVRTFLYKLEPAHAGKHLIKSVVVQFTDSREESEAKGKTSSLETEPIELEVSSEFGDALPSLADLSEMDEPRPLPREATSTSTWLLIVLGVLIVVAVVLFLVFRRHGPVEDIGPKLTPEEIAYSELQALRDAQMIEQGRFVDFYVELTGIVRRYIERTTGIHAPEQTTEEFLRAMKADSRFDAAKSLALEQFLAACDLVKYAAMHPEAKDVEDAFSRAAAFVGGEGGTGLLAQPAVVES